MSSMPKIGKNRGNAGKGRGKGVPNKTTRAAKEAIALAADELGGVEGLVAWARSDEANLRIFWGNIYPKLLPHQIEGAGADGLVVFKTVYEAN